MHRKATIGLILIGFVPAWAGAQNTTSTFHLKPRHFEVHRAAGAIRIDGQLGDAGWKGAAHWDLPYEWQPGDNTKPPVDTEFYVTYDDKYLYAAWHCADPDPSKIRAHYMDRDSIDTFVQDDHVVLLIDTFDDERRAYQFRINPLGVQADAFNSETEGIEDWSFDLIWSSAARITSEGWDVEIAIPFSQLRFPHGSDPQTWGFDVGRSWPRSVRHRINSWPRDRSRNCGLCQVDKVSGFQGMKSGHNLELDPTATAIRTDQRSDFPAGPMKSGDVKSDLGLTARWSVTSNLTLSAAANPDFSQVEADAAQLAVNQRFALFFPEKRPFFLEGVDLFATPIDAVFTRTVVDPSWGFKLSGKQGRNALGAFATEDGVTSFLIPSNQSSESVFLPGEQVTDSVLRYRRDLGSNSSLGVLYTGREGDAYHNRVGGLDGYVRLDANNTFQFQALRSTTLYPGDVASRYGQPVDPFGGSAFLGKYAYQSRDWQGSLAWEDRGERFRADSGFLPRVDIVEQRAFLQRTFWGDAGDPYTRLDVWVNLQHTENHAGQLTDEIGDVSASYFGALQSVIQLTLDERKVFYGGRLFTGLFQQQLYGEIQPSGTIKLTLTGIFGDAIDVDNVRKARIFELAPTLEAKLGRHVNAQIGHTLQKLDDPGGKIYEANLSQLRLVYNFGTRTFVRAIVQYLDLSQNPNAYLAPVDRDIRHVFTQLLFSYKINPQTVLFVGYSDNSDGTQDYALARANRTFFAKVGYALLF